MTHETQFNYVELSRMFIGRHILQTDSIPQSSSSEATVTELFNKFLEFY